MSDGDIKHRLDAYLQEQAERPFGDTELVSGQTLAPFSRAGITAADNLLVKADRALAVGERERAGRLIDRAARLDWDRHEQTAPVAWAVSVMLFNAVTDALESSDEGDSRWLDAAVDALATSSGWGRAELRHTLLVACQDYEVTSHESRTIRSAAAEVPEWTELRDATMPAPELVQAVTSVLQALHAYRAALSRSTG